MREFDLSLIFVFVVIYTHGAQTSLRHPGYTNYISRQPVIPGQPGLLPG